MTEEKKLCGSCYYSNRCNNLFGISPDDEGCINWVARVKDRKPKRKKKVDFSSVGITQ